MIAQVILISIIYEKGNEMQSFNRYYFNEKISADIRRAFTSNLLKKRKVGISIDKLPYIGKFERNQFNKLEDFMTREYRDGQALKDRISKAKGPEKSKIEKDYGPFTVTNVYSGELDDQAAKLEDTISNIRSMAVYEVTVKGDLLSLGGKRKGRIILLTFENNKSEIVNYIGLDKKGEEYFRKLFGTTFEAFKARSEQALQHVRSTIQQRKLKKIDNIISTHHKDHDTNIDSDIDTAIDVNETELGLLDITKDEYDTLFRKWGDGKRGIYRGLFHRTNFQNNLGVGYKYSDGDHSVYLIDMDDSQDELIIFDGKISHKWAERLDMIELWRSSKKMMGIRWTNADIKNLPEGKQYE